MESHAGKNPFRSAGRLYPRIARLLSQRLSQDMHADVTVGLQASNGHPLAEPSVIVALDRVGRHIPVPDLGLSSADIVAACQHVLQREEIRDDLRGRPPRDVPQ